MKNNKNVFFTSDELGPSILGTRTFLESALLSSEIVSGSSTTPWRWPSAFLPYWRRAVSKNSRRAGASANHSRDVCKVDPIDVVGHRVVVAVQIVARQSVCRDSHQQ